MHDFNACVRLQEVDLKHPYACLDKLKAVVKAKLAELCTRFPQHVEQVDALGRELEQLGLTPDTAYLYMQGHHIMDNVVLRLLIPICTLLRREREQEIKRLAGHDEQRRNELAGYENSQASVQVMLKKNGDYKDLYLYQWIRDDIARFLDNNR